MKKNYTLIMPMLDTSPKYKDKCPIEFQYNNETGIMNCIETLDRMDLRKIDSIHFIILKEHDNQYDISRKIKSAIKFDEERYEDIDIIISKVKNPTISQAQTIYDEITRYELEGPIIIKDADNACDMDLTNAKGNFVFVYPLELTPIVDPQHKSYIAVDDQNFVTNIIEKRVISNLFNCGGYGFNDAKDFKTAYEALLEYEDINNHMYISHIIYWLILNKKLKFRPLEATGYEDFEIK
jgi:hypothetical protein